MMQFFPMENVRRCTMYKSIMYSSLNHGTPLPIKIIHALTIRHTTPLLARSDQVTSRPRIAWPSTSQSRTTVLLRKVLHALLQLRSEVANEALNGPCKSLAKS